MVCRILIVWLCLTFDSPTTFCHSLSEFTFYHFSPCPLHSSHSGLFAVPQCTKHAPAPGPLHWLFSLARMQFPYDNLAYCLSSFSFCSDVPLLWRPSQNTPFKLTTTPCPQSNAPSLILLYSFPLCYLSNSRIPFNSLIHDVHCQFSPIGIQALEDKEFC